MWKYNILTKSLCSDARFALTDDKFLTGKHCAVVLGFTQPDKREATSSLLLKLRKSIRQKIMKQIESAQTELAQNFLPNQAVCY